jgi:hypothetical protein
MPRGRPVRIDVGVRVKDRPARDLVKDLTGGRAGYIVGSGHRVEQLQVRILENSPATIAKHAPPKLAVAAQSRKHEATNASRAQDGLILRVLHARGARLAAIFERQ